MLSIAGHERGLTRFILEEFIKLDGKKFRCYGITDPSLSGERDPTFAFDIIGLDPREIKQLLWDRSGIQIADGNHYSAAVVRHLGRESLCRASFAHYDNLETARTFIKAVGELIQ
jgi:selenocysteine lyase/cysteine desulfurase